MGMSENLFMQEVVRGNGFYHMMFFRKKNYQNRSWQAMIFDSSRIPSPTDQELSDAFQQYLSNKKYSIEELFRLAQVDYIYWGAKEKYYFDTIDPGKLDFLEKVFSTNAVEIYRVRY